MSQHYASAYVKLISMRGPNVNALKEHFYSARTCGYNTMKTLFNPPGGAARVSLYVYDFKPSPHAVGSTMVLPVYCLVLPNKKDNCKVF